MVNGFTKIENSILLNSSISLDAKGLFMVIKYYTSIPNFKLNREHIKTVSGLGEHAFRRVWKELKECGLLLENKSHNNGRIVYNYSIVTEKVEAAKEVVEASEEVKEIVENTGITEKESKQLLKVADVKTIIKYVRYVQAKGNKVKNLVAYAKELIINKVNIAADKVVQASKGSFSNYQQRDYSGQWESIENKLLGWDF